jgi:PAS domain S-box-containing protein
MNASAITPEWDQRTSAPGLLLKHTDAVFDSLFERSADAIWLYDPQSALLVDCNQAALELIGAENKKDLLPTSPEHLSPLVQPDGSRSSEKSAQIIATVERQKGHHFEWLIRRLDGREVPVEVTSTAVLMSGKTMHVVISRDISERKRAERELVELNQSLERRVSERTAALSTSEARLRALVEHAPEAIVVFDGTTGRFLFGNEHACRLYGVSMERLAELTPVDVSPEFQADGQRSRDLAREKMDEALAGGTPIFEWIHQQPNGRLIPTEVRLLRLPSEGQNLIRASIIDNAERKRAEQALRESEQKFRALFEGSSHGVVLHDANEILEVNPAAVRIMRRQSPDELIGKNPRDLAPLFQPGGERSDVLGNKYIEECMTKGSARFEWVGSAPSGEDIPLEVALTRIEWSGRQVIQAFITDITERKQAEQALVDANRDLHREVEQRTRAEESLKQRVRMSTLNAEVAVALNAGDELRAMLQRCAELVVRNLDVAFARIWTLDSAAQTLELLASAGCYTHLDGFHSRIRIGQYKIGLIAQERKPHLTNNVQTDPQISDRSWAAREGMVAFAGYPLLLEDRVLGVLAMFARHPLEEGVLNTLASVADSVALGIERKRAQTALAESEARFSAAFQASPILIGIARMSDERFVLANEALLNWAGYTRDEVLGRKTTELSIWERPEDREAFWADMRRLGSLRERECRWRNRSGKCFTMLMSSEVIQHGHAPHLLCLALDITQRKNAEVEIIKALAREKELSQLKSNFVSMVSHEFRTPLGIIQSSAELLRDFFPRMEPAERDEQLESIARNTRRMAGMMEEILVLSRLEAGKLDFRPSALDFKSFCRRLVDELLSATNQRCPVELSLESVPSQALADERLLGHIFINLLSNAVKYSKPGGAVRFEVSRDGTEARCRISDQGIGISEEDRKRLFTAFHRGYNVGNRQGTGLGLLVVKRCVELHLGNLEIESRLGKGTTVTVRLPVFSESRRDEKDPGD